MKKIYVLDTNVLLYDPNCLTAFEENEVVIPLSVIEELDTFKNNETDTGRNARQTIRTLDDFRSLGSLHTGVSLPNNGFLRIELNHTANIPAGLDQKKTDNRIIGVVLGILKQYPERKTILVSKDINMRVKCDSFGVESQDYQKGRPADSIDDLYSGFMEVFVKDEEIDDFHNNKSIYLELESNPNQFLLLKSEINPKKSALAIFIKKELPLKKVLEYKDIWGINAKNKEQLFALNLLMDPDIKLVSLVGLAGSGKTLLALAAALEQTIEKKFFKRILISRPIQAVGKELGFLPGSLGEKLNPWMASFNDNLELLFGNNHKNLDLLKETDIIQVEALSYIRGRSIPNSFIIFDEAQNSSPHEIKTLITRAGEGTKIVLIGDVEQIDAPYLDGVSNGLSITLEKFKKYTIAGHMTLKSGVRSELATLAAKIL